MSADPHPSAIETLPPADPPAANGTRRARRERRRERGHSTFHPRRPSARPTRVVVAGDLPREAHNAPLHLFSAAPELVGFGGRAYHRRSERTSQLLGELFEELRREGFAMPYTMADFERDYMKKHFPRLTPEEQEEVLQSLPPEQRLAGLTEDQIRQYLDRLSGGRPAPGRKPRRKK